MKTGILITVMLCVGLFTTPMQAEEKLTVEQIALKAYIVAYQYNAKIVT